MKNAIDDILKSYPFIGDDIRREQATLNEYLKLQEELRQMEPLKANRITGEGHGYDVNDPTYNHVERVIDKYQDKINEQVAKINDLIDRQKWLDKAYASLTEDERRIVCLRYNDRWATWDIMSRLHIKKYDTFYKILDSARDKINKIMTT